MSPHRYEVRWMHSYSMNAVGDFLQLQGAARGILPCKVSATGENLCTFKVQYYKGKFTLQNERRRRFF